MSTTMHPDSEEEIEHHYSVLPLVPAGWERDQQLVFAWLVDDDSELDEVPRQLGAYRGRGRGEHEEAIEDACKRYGLRVAEGAPLLFAQRDPQGALRERISWASGVWGVLFALWLVGTIAHHLHLRRAG